MLSIFRLAVLVSIAVSLLASGPYNPPRPNPPGSKSPKAKKPKKGEAMPTGEVPKK